jgi:alpha-tubulin suppressor-like RCC1 family protein
LAGEIECSGSAPTNAVADLDTIAFYAVRAGGLHSCALSSEGAVWCFGDDLNGQLGDGPVNSSGKAVNAIAGGAVSIDVGSLHSCAALEDGRVRCWGENNNGRLGNGQSGGVETQPVDVVGFGD